MPEHRLSVEGLSKTFETDKGQVLAVDAVDFEIEGSEFFTMLGPSGCGKTTTLRLIAGLESLSSGRILFDGQDYSRVSHLDRNIGMVFQSYALFPHMTVFENAAYGLRLRSATNAEVSARVGKALELLGLQQLSDRYPADLSGGQQQRVAIARALVYDPIMLLLDEPLANLDAKLRVEMREEIRRVQKELGIMALYVTHDQEEAMAVSDRVAVFHAGRLMQVGPPADIYADPSSLFVADFVGKANFFTASAIDQPVKRVRSMDSEQFRPPGYTGGPLAMVRPEHVTLTSATAASPESAALSGRVKRIQFLGSIHTYLVESDHAISDVIADSPRAVEGVGEGDTVRISIAADDAIVFEPGEVS